jgi:TolB protein
MIAYADDSGGFDLVYAMLLDNYTPASQPEILGQGKQPAWSVDGGSMVFVNEANGQSRIIAGNVGSFSVAPQAFTGNGKVSHPDWTGSVLPRNLASRLVQVQPDASVVLYQENFVQQPTFDGSAPYLLQEISVNVSSPYLSERVDESFIALQNRLVESTGWDILANVDNMFESLNAAPLPGQSNRTWNKAGRAFDLNAEMALALDPKIEIVREDAAQEVYWRIYARAAVQDGSMGEPLLAVPWDFRARFGQDALSYDDGGKLKEGIPTGYYVDVTAIAEKYGWERVAASDGWRTYYPSIQWWHFEKRDNLTWQQAMLELYTSAEMAGAFTP